MEIVASPLESVGTSPRNADTPFPHRERTETWQQLVKSAIRDPGELARRLGLPAPERPDDTIAAHRQFRTFVPEPYLTRIRPCDPYDPLLLQVMPRADEMTSADGFLSDPVGDLNAMDQPGLIRKYRGRALLVASGVCAVNCRYCFRRHFPYEAAPRSLGDMATALQPVRDDATIQEVILSGGDPLTLTDARLESLVEEIGQIAHVRRLRIHTRLPVVIPQRVTVSLLRTLSGSRLVTIVVLHINHAREIDDAVVAAARRLASSGSMLLNQSVLLRAINDDAATLIELSERLINTGITPYYLHQLDRVRGAAHFEAPVERGRELIAAMRRALPGYAVPRYVCEEPGADSKTLLA